MNPSLAQIHSRHGGQLYDNGKRWLGPGPGHSKRDLSLSAYDAGDGRLLVHSFANDPLRACFEHLGIERGDAEKMDRQTFERLKRDREASAKAERARKLAFCEAVWAETIEGEGSPAGVYLRRSRKLPLSSVPPALRYHPAAPLSYPWSEGEATKTAAMVAMVTDVFGRGVGIHVTPLLEDGSRSRRKKIMFGSPSGGAVRLSDFEGTLAVGEGIETALAYAAIKGRPAWAALSTSGLMRFEIPRNVRTLVIAADTDDEGAGVQAAINLMRRAVRSCDVEVDPAPEGLDWAKVMEARQ